MHVEDKVSDGRLFVQQVAFYNGCIFCIIWPSRALILSYLLSTLNAFQFFV